MVCIPALIYLVYTIIYILVDIKNNLYNNMMIKIWISILVFGLLNVLCSYDLNIIAWLIICIPFIYMILVMAILIYVVQVNPSTGISTQSTDSSSNQTSTSQTTDSSSNQTSSTPTIVVTPTTFGIGL